MHNLMLGLGLLVTATLATAQPQAATHCPVAATADGFVAHYRQTAGDNTRALTMLRLPHWAGYQAGAPNTNNAQLWQRLPRDHTELYRVFPRYQRSILYTVSGLDLRGQPSHWANVSNLVNPAQLKIAARHPTPCGPREQREGELGATHAALSWYPDSGLIEHLILSRAGHTTEYTLARAEGPEQARALANTWRRYRSTDFADIGDNETDPFLNKMIRMGFVQHGGSGIYDSDGHQPDH